MQKSLHIKNHIKIYKKTAVKLIFKTNFTAAPLFIFLF